MNRGVIAAVFIPHLIFLDQTMACKCCISLAYIPNSGWFYLFLTHLVLRPFITHVAPPQHVAQYNLDCCICYLKLLYTTLLSTSRYVTVEKAESARSFEPALFMLCAWYATSTRSRFGEVPSALSHFGWLSDWPDKWRLHWMQLLFPKTAALLDKQTNK